MGQWRKYLTVVIFRSGLIPRCARLGPGLLGIRRTILSSRELVVHETQYFTNTFSCTCVGGQHSRSRCRAGTSKRRDRVLQVLTIILAPCFSLLTSCYLPSATQDLFSLLVVSGVFAVGCLPPRTSPACSQRCTCTVKLKRRPPL
jgi:hypothetical protein